MRHQPTTVLHPWRRLLWVAVALLLVGNQSAFRVGVPAAAAATSVACCHCPPGHCHCGHAHRKVARCCTHTGGSCLCTATPVHHAQAGLIHADWPPTLLAAVAPPVVAPRATGAAALLVALTEWWDPPPLPPPQVG